MDPTDLQDPTDDENSDDEEDEAMRIDHANSEAVLTLAKCAKAKLKLRAGAENVVLSVVRHGEPVLLDSATTISSLRNGEMIHVSAAKQRKR